MKLGLFSASQTCRLAKISEGRLSYWYRTKVFRPQSYDRNLGPFRRVYSFRDVVGLRTITILRDAHHVNLSDIREIERRLKATPDTEWSSLTFYIGEDGQVYFEDPSTKIPVAVSPLGQVSLFPIRLIILQVERQLVLMNRRTEGQIGRVTNNRYVMHNASIVAGTRIPTSAIFDLYQSGFSIPQIIIEYPRLTEKDVRAAINWEQIRVAS